MSLQWALLEMALIFLCSTKTDGVEIENANLAFIGISCWTECKEVFLILMLTNKVREWKVIFVEKGIAVLKTLKALKVSAKQQLEWITIIVNNILCCRRTVSQSIQIPNISMMHELALWLPGHDWNNGLKTSHHTPSISHSVSEKWKAQLSYSACKYLPELSMDLRFSIT